ncbi:stability determinant [Caballeronia sp. BR00000012568055]|uniref:type II toxin-antitoxin system RelB family antitoxin n=1 Tax=Caballeronia sp. BR00000012568055 TaxID=2918761 RepID=UPI0023F76B52|nr:stability determinant [Caballeronia sp. BR00000012568055]
MPTPLDPIVSEFATVEEAEAYDKWFREKVRRSMADTRPRIPHEEVMAEIRAKLEAKIKEKERSQS